MQLWPAVRRTAGLLQDFTLLCCRALARELGCSHHLQRAYPTGGCISNLRCQPPTCQMPGTGHRLMRTLEGSAPGRVTAPACKPSLGVPVHWQGDRKAKCPLP